MGLILPERTYPAKLLLFGEYVILDGAAGLSLPFPHFHGKIELSDEEKPYWADEWCQYLNKHCASFLDMNIVTELLETHRYVSSIPVGAGLGSSGALTAALYDAASQNDGSDLSIIKYHLALMESYFHGSSSGLDPLVSWTNQGIYCRADGSIETITVKPPTDIKLYLLDSTQSRIGKEMIADFLKTIRGTTQLGKLSTMNDQLIERLIHVELTFQEIQAFSALQYEVMQPMIIDPLKELWREGLENSKYAMKLCGAGGGGYYLVFSEKERDHINGFQLLEVHFSGDV